MNRCLLCRCPKHDEISGRETAHDRASSDGSLAARARAVMACPVGAVQSGLWFVAGHPVAVMTAVVALTMGVAVEVAGPVACLVDAGVIGTAAFGPRSIGRIPWSWSHACRFRRRLPRCRRLKVERIGVCRVGDRLVTLPRFHRDGTLTWTAHALTVDEVAEANLWLRWLAERDAKIAAVESVLGHYEPPMVEIRVRLCGPGQWSAKAERVAGTSVPIGVAPDPDTPDRLGGVIGDGDGAQTVRLGVVSDADVRVDSAESADGSDGGRQPVPTLQSKYWPRDVPAGADPHRPGSTGAA